MLESPEAIGNADAIAAVPGVDVLFIGTSDLTAELGISGQMGHAKVIAAYQPSATPAASTARRSAWAAFTTRRMPLDLIHCFGAALIVVKNFIR